MEKRIELERRARKANQIVELNLDNCRSTSIVGLTDEYTSLESLSLINVGLVTLKGFPKLPNLMKLELSDNRISGGLAYLQTSPKLQYLNLSGNKIKDLEALKPLEKFRRLTILDLFNNEATQIENYRDKIFEMLPSLRFLDGFDCNDVEAPSEADDEEENGNYSEDEDDDDDSDDDSDSDAYGSNDSDDDISLSEVYRKDLEEDEEGEWDEENAAESNDDFDDVDSDEDEANESTVSNAGKTADGNASAEEPQSRGKKRKHEG